MHLTPAEWDRLEGTMFRYLLAAQTGRANALVPAAEAEQFAPSSNSQVYELLAYGDSRLESDTAEPHANSIQRVRFEMIQDRAEVAALAKAVGALAEAQGTPIDMQAIKDMVQKTVQDGLAALELRIVPGETPPPVQ